MFKRLFNKKNKAVIFVDYEYWFYSYLNMVGIRPNPGIYMDALQKEFNVSDTFVFGDFSGSGISEELWIIREFTITIIETGNTHQKRKKDVTDFVMLDYIYQCIDDRKDILTENWMVGDCALLLITVNLLSRK